jgi:hypothetical protein
VRSSLLALLVLSACMLPSPAEVNAQHCVNTVTQFDEMYCANITRPDLYRAYEVEHRHASIRGQCPDATSQQRLLALQPCVDGYRGVVAARASHDATLRRRYASQVAALRADPAYTPTRDVYRAARDEVELAEREFERQGRPMRSAYERELARKSAELAAAADRLRDLIIRHGIEPAHSEPLGVW